MALGDGSNGNNRILAIGIGARVFRALQLRVPLQMILDVDLALRLRTLTLLDCDSVCELTPVAHANAGAGETIDALGTH